MYEPGALWRLHRVQGGGDLLPRPVARPSQHQANATHLNINYLRYFFTVKKKIFF